MMRAIAFPFRTNASGQITLTMTYEEVVRAQVIDALMTNQGERVFKALYGCDVQAAVFDPQDELVRRDAAGQIKSRLQALVPRCIVREVSVDIDTLATLNVTILYRPSLYATDTSVTVPVSSEFITRMHALKGLNP